MTNSRYSAIALLVAAASCSKPSRQYSHAEVVGEYVFAKDNEGLVLGQDGTFEHCWRDGATGAASEHGEWQLRSDDDTHSSVTLFHRETNKAKRDSLRPIPDGPWMEGLRVAEVGGRVGLMLTFYSKGRYYVKEENGQHVCPRP